MWAYFRTSEVQKDLYVFPRLGSNYFPTPKMFYFDANLQGCSEQGVKESEVERSSL